MAYLFALSRQVPSDISSCNWRPTRNFRCSVKPLPRDSLLPSATWHKGDALPTPPQEITVFHQIRDLQEWENYFLVAATCYMQFPPAMSP